jgi:hypothetical protein
MLRTLRKTLSVVLAVLCIASAVGLAAESTLSGTVQNVDPQQGRIIVKSGQDRVIELRAPSDLLTGLQSGDAVEVTRRGQQATFIRRQEGVQQPEIGGTLRFEPPIELPKSP